MMKANLRVLMALIWVFSSHLLFDFVALHVSIEITMSVRACVSPSEGVFLYVTWLVVH